MRSRFLLFLLCAVPVLAVVATPIAHACGYMAWSEFAEAPETASERLLRGRHLPLLSPSWNSEYWLVAWARLNGKVFSEAEAESLQAGWLVPHEAHRNAMRMWTNARATVRPGRHYIRPGRESGYNMTIVCAADAFRTAAQTLQQRQGQLSQSALESWVDAQDRVFAACSDTAAPRPADVTPGTTGPERDDRAYQQAVWAEYTGQEDARAAYLTIASSQSEWADIARYRALRLQSRSQVMDPAAYREAMVQVQDPKARRALRQLLDRETLYLRPAAEVVEALLERLMHEDLGGDLGRTLKDIVHFAKRAQEPCATVPLMLASYYRVHDCATQRPWVVADDPLGYLVRLRQNQIDTAMLRSLQGAPLLRLNMLFHRGRRLFRQGRERGALRDGRQMHRLAAHSTAATRNAAAALVLAASRGRAGLPYVVRESTNGRRIFSDGSAFLQERPMQDWFSLGSQVPELASRIEQEAFLATLSRGDMRRARQHARVLVTQRNSNASHGNGSIDEFHAEVTQALEEPTREQHAAFLLAVLKHHPSQITSSAAFIHHEGSLQNNGCAFGTCEDTHPHQTAVSTLRAQTPREVPRFIAFGQHVLAFVRRNPGHPAAAELLARLVRMTRYAANHSSGPRVGLISRTAFSHLHEHYGDSQWAQNTRYWYR